MFDTHCHLQNDAFQDDLANVLEGVRLAGVSAMLVPAVDYASFAGTVAIAEREPDVYFALGIHPHSAAEWSEGVREEIESTAQHDQKMLAVGEIGLDYYYDFAPRDVQQRVFREQIHLAKKLAKPVIIHTRDSAEDAWRIVEEEYSSAPTDAPRGQFHCFSEGVEFMHEVTQAGFYVSFTGNITFKKSTLSEVVREAPLDKILLETDSPYMTPVPFRGKRNTPAHLRLVAEKIADLKALTVEEVIAATTANARRLFAPRLAVSAILLLLAILFVAPSTSNAQPGRNNPVGGAPPDSVMTPERRKAEELRKKQLEELEKEQEQRRQDSVRREAELREEARVRMVQQQRTDSLRAAEKAAEDERQRLKALTPMPWKAIGIGGGIGIGNLEMNQSKSSITPTSVLAKSIQIGGHITRNLDLEASYSTMSVFDDLGLDSLVRHGGTDIGTGPRGSGRLKVGDAVPTYEEQVISLVGFDLRLVITPRTSFKFYTGIGYANLSVKGLQKYRTVTVADSLDRSKVEYGGEQTYQSDFSRGAIKLLFGVRYDLELSDQFTLTPFAQISALGAFGGKAQGAPFVLRADPDQITMTHLNVGATLYFGWFGVDRLK